MKQVNDEQIPWSCSEEQKVCAIEWTKGEWKRRFMNPLRYINRLLIRESDRTLEEFYSPEHLIPWLKASRLTPFYKSDTRAGPAQRWFSEDGITIFSYYSMKNILSISTRFTDGRSIVSFNNSLTKVHTDFLPMQNDNLTVVWRVHREAVKEKIQTIAALERRTIEQHIAYEDYWTAFCSSILIPVFTIASVLMILFFLTSILLSIFG